MHAKSTSISASIASSFVTSLAGAAALFSVSTSTMAQNQSADELLDAFPTANSGYERYVVRLPEKSREESLLYAVEIIPTAKLPTDGVNIQQVDYRVFADTLKGWGYPMFFVEGSGVSASTLMAVRPKPMAGGDGNAADNENTDTGQTDVQQTADVAGDSLMVPYNSRLPMVIYAPAHDNLRVEYRIWAASDKSLQATAQ